MSPDELAKINETFCCPVCQTNACRYVIYTSPAGKRVPMPWYSCAGCTAMFTDPHRFTVLMRRTERQPSGPGQYGHVEEAQLKGERPLLEWERSRLGERTSKE
jgi:hypothetical protein